MKPQRLWPALLLALVTGGVHAQAAPALRNTDKAWLGWWSMDVATATVEAVLPRLPGPPRWVAPGERVALDIGRTKALVVVFVPWNDRPGYTTPVVGGVIRPEALPTQGTLLVDQGALVATQAGRELRAPLQAWNLVPRPLVLDGSGSEWSGTPAWSWAPGFQTPRPWGRSPQPRELRLADVEGALWLWFGWEGRPSGAVSLMLSGEGGALEWSLGDPVVWAWTGDRARAVGRSVVSDQGLEAWIPWDRLTEAERRDWGTGATWSMLVSEGNSVQTFVLGEGGLRDAP